MIRPMLHLCKTALADFFFGGSSPIVDVTGQTKRTNSVKDKSTRLVQDSDSDVEMEAPPTVQVVPKEKDSAMTDVVDEQGEQSTATTPPHTPSDNTNG